MKDKQLKLLSIVKAGTKVRLERINAGNGLNSRLSTMGLIPKTEITVINNGHPGPIIVDIKGFRLILGRGIAHKIFVS